MALDPLKDLCRDRHPGVQVPHILFFKLEQVIAQRIKQGGDENEHDGLDEPVSVPGEVISDTLSRSQQKFSDGIENSTFKIQNLSDLMHEVASVNSVKAFRGAADRAEIGIEFGVTVFAMHGVSG